MFALIAAVLFGISFILYWTGNGHVPLDSTGLMLLGLLFFALHFPYERYPWRR